MPILHNDAPRKRYFLDYAMMPDGAIDALGPTYVTPAAAAELKLLAGEWEAARDTPAEAATKEGLRRLFAQTLTPGAPSGALERLLPAESNAYDFQIAPGLTVLISQRGGQGKTLLLSQIAGAAASSPGTSLSILRFNEPPDAGDSDRPMQRVASSFMDLWRAAGQTLDTDGLVLVDSLSDWTLVGDNLASGGIARDVTAKMKALSASLSSAGRYMVATLNAQFDRPESYAQFKLFMLASCEGVIDALSARDGSVRAEHTARASGRRPMQLIARGGATVTNENAGMTGIGVLP
jgi:hypothetical protein